MNKIKSFFKKYFGENECELEFKQHFSDKALWTLILPLIVEQFLGTLMGIADTVMVSSQGDAAVSGVSLVDMIFVLFFNYSPHSQQAELSSQAALSVKKITKKHADPLPACSLSALQHPSVLWQSSMSSILGC